MLSNKDKVSEYSKMIINTNYHKTTDKQQEMDSVSQYIRKALEAKDDQDKLFASSCKQTSRFRWQFGPISSVFLKAK